MGTINSSKNPEHTKSKVQIQSQCSQLTNKTMTNDVGMQQQKIEKMITDLKQDMAK
jgi:hypothetical protein